MAARLERGGFRLTDDPETADAVVVNTCGFVESAKKDSVDTLLAAADLKDSGRARAVVAVGCLAERYGAELADALPEADAVLGFDDYADVAGKLRGGPGRRAAPAARTAGPPRVAPADSGRSAGGSSAAARARSRGDHRGSSGRGRAGHRATAAPPAERVAVGAAQAGLGLRSAVQLLRHPGLSRGLSVPAGRRRLAEARWLAESGVREVLLVSENSSSYGKDLGDLRLLEGLLPQLAAVDGLERVRVSYLQPAEMRPGLIEVMAGTPGVVPVLRPVLPARGAPVLRRMRRFGDPDAFLNLLASIRALAPDGRDPQQRDLRLPRARPRATSRCCATSWSRRSWT